MGVDFSSFNPASLFRKRCRWFLEEFGTTRPVLGSTWVVEKALMELIRSSGLTVVATPNAKRPHCHDETTHRWANRNRKVLVLWGHPPSPQHGHKLNLNMYAIILLTRDHLYLLIPDRLSDLSSYLVNSGNALVLRRKLLTTLRKTDYPFITEQK